MVVLSEPLNFPQSQDFSDAIQVEFGLDKCECGTLTETSNVQIDPDTCIKELQQEGTYKYLDVNEGLDGWHSTCYNEREGKKGILQEDKAVSQE